MKRVAEEAGWMGRLQVTLASYKLWTYCVPRCQQVASTDSCGAGLLQCQQAQSTKLWKPKEARLARSWLYRFYLGQVPVANRSSELM